MSGITVFTNNSVVADYFKKKNINGCTIKWISAPAMEVLTAVHAAVRQGAVLVTNPMVGVHTKPLDTASGGRNLFAAANSLMRSPAKSVKPVVFNPYLTVVTIAKEDDSVDFASLKNVDEALSLYKKNARLRFVAHDDNAIQRFQMIDMDILLTMLATLFDDIEFDV